MSQIQVELQEWMGSDAAIANAAWTSTYNKEKREDKYDDPEKVCEIVRRLVREGHSTPLESVVFRFWLRMPIFSDRQHMTYRMQSPNGLSGRYRKVPDDFHELPDDVCDIFDRISPESGLTVWAEHDDLLRDSYLWYETKLGLLRSAERAGVVSTAEFRRAREVLRGVLGTAFMTERTAVFNLVSFANMQRQRNTPESGKAQRETCEVAQKMLAAVIDAKVCPVALGALMDKGWLIAEPNHEWQEWVETV